jgi:hypothetical protein
MSNFVTDSNGQPVRFQAHDNFSFDGKYTGSTVKRITDDIVVDKEPVVGRDLFLARCKDALYMGSEQTPNKSHAAPLRISPEEGLQAMHNAKGTTVTNGNPMGSEEVRGEETDGEELTGRALYLKRLESAWQKPMGE